MAIQGGGYRLMYVDNDIYLREVNNGKKIYIMADGVEAEI